MQYLILNYVTEGIDHLLVTEQSTVFALLVSPFWLFNLITRNLELLVGRRLSQRVPSAGYTLRVTTRFRSCLACQIITGVFPCSFASLKQFVRRKMGTLVTISALLSLSQLAHVMSWLSKVIEVAYNAIYISSTISDIVAGRFKFHYLVALFAIYVSAVYFARVRSESRLLYYSGQLTAMVLWLLLGAHVWALDFFFWPCVLVSGLTLFGLVMPSDPSPFPCGLCGVRFPTMKSDAWELKAYYRTHSGQKVGVPWSLRCACV